MPPASTAPATGPAGKGMTIENGTGQTLHVHFSGPVSRTVVVPDGRSESVELAVGEYQVAAEIPGSRVIPFYGRQAYQPFTHYWLKFYTQRLGSATQPLPRSEGAAESRSKSEGANSAMLGLWEGIARSPGVVTTARFAVVEVAGGFAVTSLDFEFGCSKGSIGGSPLPFTASSLVDLRAQRYPIDSAGSFSFNRTTGPIVLGLSGTGRFGGIDLAEGTVRFLGSISIQCNGESFQVGGNWTATRKAR
jgi:hypothetical protein